MHPVKDIGISSWPVDKVEFGADAYAHRKQVDVKQKYNQVPQTAWVCSVPVAVGVSRVQDASVRISLQTQSLRPSVTHGWAAQPGRERSAAMVRRTWGKYVAVCPVSNSPLTFNHINPFERLYFYKEVCSFVHWSRHYCWLCFRLYLYMYCAVVLWVYNNFSLINIKEDQKFNDSSPKIHSELSSVTVTGVVP